MEKSNKDKSHSKTHVPKEQHKSSFESVEKPKKSNRSHHKRKPDSERDKQKAELERSGNELKRLLAQFGSKAKVADEIERDTTKLRGNIRELMTKAKAKEKEKSRLHDNHPKARLDATPHHHNQNETTTSSSTSLTSLLPIIWNHLMSFVTMILRPLQVLYQSYERLYCKPNWTLFLMVVLVFELSIIGLIWKIRQRQYYMHFEPYEAVVHGTFGVEPTFWYYLCMIFTSVKDFLGEMRHGGRSFGSPSYDGLVPI